VPSRQDSKTAQPTSRRPGACLAGAWAANSETAHNHRPGGVVLHTCMPCTCTLHRPCHGRPHGTCNSNTTYQSPPWAQSGLFHRWLLTRTPATTHNPEAWPCRSSRDCVQGAALQGNDQPPLSILACCCQCSKPLAAEPPEYWRTLQWPLLMEAGRTHHSATIKTPNPALPVATLAAK
jgi:hypothetical protein